MSKSLVKNSMYKLLLNIFNLLIPLIVSPYVLRIIGNENLGKINFAESIYTYFFAFASIGIYQYGVREVAKIRNDKKKLSQFFTSCFLLTLISSAVILFVFLIFIAISDKLQPISLILYIYAINIFSNVFYVEWANEGFENYKFITIKTIILRLIYIVGIFTLLKSREDFIFYVLLNGLFILFNNLVSFIFIKRNIGFDFTNIKFKKHIKFLIASFVISNAGILFYQVDKTMLGIFGDSVTVSLYSVSNMIMFIILTLIQTIITVSIPRLTNYISNNNSDEYYKLLNRLYKIYCMFTFPIAIGLMLLSKEILYIYGGSEFVSAASTLKIFAIFLIVMNIEMFVRNQIMYVNNKEKAITVFLIFAGIGNIVLNAILLPMVTYKSEMAIAKTTVIITLLLIAEVVYIKRVMKVDFKIINKDIFRYLVLSLSFIVVNFVLNLVIKNTLITFFMTPIICVILYFGALFFLKDDMIFLALKRKS